MRRLLLLALAVLCCSGCRQPSFYHQPVERNLRPAPALAQWTRHAAPGSVARDAADETDPRISGSPDRSSAGLPVPLNRALVERGHERYDIYCAPCHGRAGYGDGLIVQRGFPHPPSFHDASLRGVGEAYVVHVITHGYGRMASYADRVRPPDRWAIAAYVKALQLSQDFPVAALSADEQRRLDDATRIPAPRSKNSPAPGTWLP